MAFVHLMCGFIGTGKTTIARKLSVQTGAVLLSHDDVMRRFFGRTPDDFHNQYKIADDFIWRMAEQIVGAGVSVILDHGFWTRQARRDAFERARIFCENVRFHCVECDLQEARKRVLKRTAEDADSLMIDEHCFDDRLKLYEPLSEDEKYDTVYYKNV
mgnify:FL=1